MMDPTQMGGGPPPIMVGGDPGGAGGPGGPPPDMGGLLGPPGAGVPGPDSPKVTDLGQQASDIIQQMVGLEKDAPDKAILSKILADLHKFMGDQQKLQDQAMGAGPGAKMIRKATGGGY